MNRIIGIIISVGLLALSTNAQNAADVLRYSKTDFYGTARSMAMGGAFGALGADFSANSYNPAGLGMYTKSEFTISPILGFSKINSTYNQQLSEGTMERFYLGNVGATIVQPVPYGNRNTGWKYVNFSFGLNRLNDFNNYQVIDGINTQNSLADAYARLADGIYYGEIENDFSGEYAFDLSPAWWIYLIDTLGSPSEYISSAPQGPISQNKIIDTKGSMNEVVLSFGANYNDVVYIGGSLGFPYIRYHSKSFYTERKVEEDIDPSEFREFRYDESLKTKGTGVNLKFGVLIRPTGWLRIGGAIHSPTWYTNLTDEWWGTFNTRFDTPDSQGNYTYTEETPVGSYNYDMRTPWKALGSLALIIGPYGLISGDYEYVDYAAAKLSAPDYGFLSENQNIKNKFTSTHNFRVGTEWRYMSFSIRGGVALYASPYKDNISKGKRKYYSLGFGYRTNNLFVDFAWVLRASDEDYYLYGVDDVKVNPSLTEQKNQNYIVTLGMRF